MEEKTVIIEEMYRLAVYKECGGHNDMFLLPISLELPESLVRSIVVKSQELTNQEQKKAWLSSNDVKFRTDGEKVGYYVDSTILCNIKTENRVSVVFEYLGNKNQVATFDLTEKWTELQKRDGVEVI